MDVGESPDLTEPLVKLKVAGRQFSRGRKGLVGGGKGLDKKGRFQFDCWRRGRRGRSSGVRAGLGHSRLLAGQEEVETQLQGPATNVQANAK